MKVKKLCFQHHKQAPYFFKNLSFDLEKGKIHALHGKNGVGKSVLFHILSKTTLPEAVLTGEISAENVTLVDQRFDQALSTPFTFLENMQFAALTRFPRPFSRLKRYSEIMQERFIFLLEKFRIDLSLPVYKLSGGQRQILALLMKLQKEAKILLLDEPTAALDEQNADLVFEFLQALTEVTIFVVCHDKELLSRYTTGRSFCLESNSEGLRELKEFF